MASNFENQCGHPTPSSGFSLRLREWVVRHGSHSVVSQCSRWYYSKGANAALKAMGKVSGVSECWLKPGSLRGSHPGLSDLDFRIVLTREYSDQSFCELREVFGRLKRRYPILGEVLVGDRQSWDGLEKCGSAFLYLHQPTLAKKRVHSASFCAFLLEYYQKALRQLEKSWQSPFPHIERKSSERILRRGLLMAGCSPSEQWSVSDLFARFLRLLNDLADSAPKLSAEPMRMVQLRHSSRWMDPFFLASSDLALIEKTPYPRRYLYRGALNHSRLRELFENVLSIGRSLPEKSPYRLPFVMTPALYQNYVRGWSWGEGLRCLITHGEGTPEGLGADLRHCLRERLAAHRVLIAGKWVFDSLPNIQHMLQEVTLEALSLASGTASVDPNQFLKLRKVLPETWSLLQLARDPQKLFSSFSMSRLLRELSEV